MKAFNGTKGKWFAIEYAGHYNIQTGEFYGNDNVLDYENYPKEEVDANAQLIAAAPDLLEALLEFTKAVEDEDIVMYDNLDHDGFASTPNRIFTQAKRALEKALK